MANQTNSANGTPPKLNNALPVILALFALIGLLTAWDALIRYGAIIAAIYATAAILSAAAWLTLMIIRVTYSIRERHRDHAVNKAKAKAAHIAIATKTSLTQAQAMAEARQLSAAARKAEREADLFIITAKRDEQVLISDNNSSQKFTAAHLQLSGQVNGIQIPATPEQIKAWAAWQRPHSQTTTAPLIEEPITPPAELPAIIPTLVNRQRILIVGASDAGKTTLLRWLIDARGKCLVIDPHGSPGKWGGAMQIGNGTDFSKIAVTLPQLLAEAKKRHSQIGDGTVLEGQHERMTILIEEFREINLHCKEAGKQISLLLTGGRKVGMDLIVTSQSRYVKPLGLEGEGDLRKGYVIVNLSGGDGEPHRATLEFNASGIEVEYLLPGPHPDIEAAKLKAQAAEKIKTNLESILENVPMPEPEPKKDNGYDPERAAEIRKMYNNGNGMKKIDIAQAFGYRDCSGAIFYEIKEALRKTTTTTK